MRKSYRALMARGRSEWRRVRTFSSRRALAESLSAFREWAWANRQAIRARKTQERSDYLQRVESLHSRLCRIAGLLWLEGEFTPLVTNGRAAYYYGLLERGEHRWFLKVGPPHESRYRVHRALLEGALPREGHHFACLAPVRAAWLGPAAALYAYPYWPRLPGEIKGRHADPLVARGMAEFNLGLERADAASAGLRRFSLALPALTERDFDGLELPAEARLEEYLTVHHEIRTLWQEKLQILEALPKGLMHGDFSLTNFREWEGRLFLLDLDDAAIGPLGGDLGWMLFYAERIRDLEKQQRHIDKAIRRYAAACRQLGHPLEDGQAYRAARAVYFRKWLFPGVGTQANLQALAQRQREALAFLRDLQ